MEGNCKLNAAAVLVGMSELLVARGSATFSCHGLGSCVSICLFDPVAEVGGMAHVMLPKSTNSIQPAKPAKFADVAIPKLIEQLEALGASSSRLVVAIAGGAQVMRTPKQSAPWDLGERNRIAVIEALQKFDLSCLSEDCGGTEGRTVTFCLASGEIMVYTIGGGEKLLCRCK